MYRECCRHLRGEKIFHCGFNCGKIFNIIKISDSFLNSLSDFLALWPWQVGRWVDTFLCMYLIAYSTHNTYTNKKSAISLIKRTKCVPDSDDGEKKIRSV